MTDSKLESLKMGNLLFHSSKMFLLWILQSYPAEPSPPGMETNIGALGAIRTRLFLLCGNELNPLKGSV